MPRLQEFSRSNRTDLHMAIVRFYNTPEDICLRYDIIPYHEWAYFDSLCQLVAQLHEYVNGRRIESHRQRCQSSLEVDHDGHSEYDDKQIVFPCVSKLKREGPYSLYELVQKHGGRKNVARRFDIALSSHQQRHGEQTLNYGPLSLAFSLRLITFIREDMMKMEPKRRSSMPTCNDQSKMFEGIIRIPTRQELMEAGQEGKLLAEQVELYGGYESVARRLGLHW